MRLILLNDVKNLGSKFDVVDVKDSYALETLLPRRLALCWTPFTEKRYAGLAKDRTQLAQ